ncbi:MAG TPA: MFS transporter [Draconibacterium sp.]|nr:MFS transporter [Draconibacterium sp.]
MSKKPRLSFWQIWNMSFGFLGIQFGFALQNANVSRIFETLGANVENIPILWIAAPVTGLIIQPIIGHMSDKTWNRLGRRRPYFLFGAIFASLALLMMPNSPALWVAAGTLWIMDASINISMEPFRAFVGDMLPNEQRTSGFAMQSFFIGTGAVVGSLLPYVMTNWLGIANTAPEGVIPPSVRWSFYIGGVVFFMAILWTIFTTKEYPPEKLKEYEEEALKSSDILNAIDEEPVKSGNFVKVGGTFGLVGLLIVALTQLLNLEKELFILSGILLLFFVLMMLAAAFKSKNKENALVEIFSDLVRMPLTMKQLAIVQFFTWVGLFSMWIYTTAGVTSHIYGTSDTTTKLYNDGADWVNVLFAVYNGVAALIAFGLPVLAKYTSRKITHFISLVIGGVGLASVYLFKDPNWLILPMIGVGVAWASILSMPYAILTGSLPAKKMGIYMGIFNFFIVIPQILAATILGFMVKDLFGGQSILALVFGGVSMIIAAVLVLFVEDVSAEN